MQGSPGTESSYKTLPCSPGTGQMDDTQCPARNQVPGLPRVMPGSLPVLRPRWALDASLCPSHRSLSLDRRPRASHDPGFPATAASSRPHRAPLPLRVPEAAPPTRSPAVTSCHLRAVEPSAAWALRGQGKHRSVAGEPSLTTALPPSCQLRLSHTSRVRARLPQPCTTSCLSTAQGAACVKVVTQMDARGRPPHPARVSTGTANPETQRLYTEATSQWSAFQKDFKVRRVLPQAGSVTVTTVAPEHPPVEREGGPAEADGGRSGDGPQRLHWVMKHQKQYRTFTGKKHNARTLNATLL